MEHIQQSSASNCSGFIRYNGANMNDMEARYRFFLVDLPMGSSQMVDVEKVKRWVRRVFN